MSVIINNIMYRRDIIGKCKDEMIKLINRELEKVYIISEFETHYDVSKSLQVWTYDKEEDILIYYLRLNGKFLLSTFPFKLAYFNYYLTRPIPSTNLKSLLFTKILNNSSLLYLKNLSKQ